MRVLVFLLALANLLFFAYAQGYLGGNNNPDAARVAKQVNPESMRVVSRGEPPLAEKKPTENKAEADAGEVPKPEAAAPAAPTEVAKTETEKKAAEPAKESVACLAWAALSATEADRLSALLSEKFDDFRQSRRTAPAEGGAWWVFIPPQASKADADKKAAELKKLGVADFFVIQDNGPNRWAISLGVFSAEAGAKGRLAELKDKGVKSAKAGARNPKDAIQILEARGPASKQAAVQAAVGEVLAAAQAQSCQP